MGRRGPAPTPTAVKLAHGETRPSRLNWREPRGRHPKPRVPSDMDAVAKQIWHHVLREMPAGVIRSVDRDILRCYCDSMSRYVQAANLIAQSAPLVRGRGGELVKNPLHQIVRDNADAVRLFARELGLTPSARTGLRIEVSSRFGDIEDEIGPPARFRLVNRDDPQGP